MGLADRDPDKTTRFSIARQINSWEKVIATSLRMETISSLHTTLDRTDFVLSIPTPGSRCSHLSCSMHPLSRRNHKPV